MALSVWGLQLMDSAVPGLSGVDGAGGSRVSGCCYGHCWYAWTLTNWNFLLLWLGGKSRRQGVAETHGRQASLMCLLSDFTYQAAVSSEGSDEYSMPSTRDVNVRLSLLLALHCPTNTAPRNTNFKTPREIYRNPRCPSPNAKSAANACSTKTWPVTPYSTSASNLMVLRLCSLSLLLLLWWKS
jgi:hypothetical protein